MERDNARKVYNWLWWSPLLTVPTLIILTIFDPGYMLVCSEIYIGCDRDTAERVTLLIAVLGSALWHLVLLNKARNKESEFVRCHGIQALWLASIRTAVPLVFVVAFGVDFETLLFIPILLFIWFFGTLWGQNQAGRGDCSLARWFGHEDVLPEPKEDEVDVEALIESIRFSSDQEERDKALMRLRELGMVEDL